MLGIICLGVFSTALDQTVVVAALPEVMVDLEIPLTDLDTAAWIITAYLIAYTVAMPLAGRLSDVLRTRQDVSGGAGSYFRHRLGVGGSCPELQLHRAGQRSSRPSGGGATVPDRNRHGRGGRVKRKEGHCDWPSRGLRQKPGPS